METWLIYSLAAAVFYGFSWLLAKMAGGKENLALSSHTLLLLVALGMFLVSIIYYFSESKGQFPVPPTNSILFALMAGVVTALAAILVYRAFNLGANASQVAPIANMNTLVVVILAVVFLHELPNPSQAIRVVAGALLMVVGAFLVSI